jgi:hypothetical protein
VVREALWNGEAWPLSWEIESLNWAAVNPATLGLYRLTGRARVGSSEDVGWAAVLKVVGDVDLAGTPLNDGFLHDPQDWNYWKREAAAFASGLLDGWPGPLVPVRCLAVDERAGGLVWIWLEACGSGQPEGRWTLASQALLAHDLGAFAAQWADRAPSTADYPWLAQRWLRGGMASLRAAGADHALAHDGCWNHPLLAAALPSGTRQRVQQLYDSAEELLSKLESLPTTLTHHDTQASNFFLRDASDAQSRTVAIDWGFLGLAPVGHDLGCHLWSNICTWNVDPRDAADLDRGSTAAYLQGLSDFGWHGDERAVLFARAAAGALATTTMLTTWVSGLCDQAPHYLSDPGWPEALADKERLSVGTVMEQWAVGFGYALDLGEEAQRLSKVLG